MHMLRRQKGTNWLVKARSAVDNDSSRHVAWSERDSGGGRGYPGGRWSCEEPPARKDA